MATIQVRISKASRADLDVAHAVASILTDVEAGRFPSRPDEKGAPRSFDARDPAHLRELHDGLMAAMRSAPGGMSRVLRGRQVVLHQANVIFDPDEEFLDLHPHTKAALQVPAPPPHPTQSGRRGSLGLCMALALAFSLLAFNADLVTGGLRPDAPLLLQWTATALRPLAGVGALIWVVVFIDELRARRRATAIASSTS